MAKDKDHFERNEPRLIHKTRPPVERMGLRASRGDWDEEEMPRGRIQGRGHGDEGDDDARPRGKSKKKKVSSVPKRSFKSRLMLFFLSLSIWGVVLGAGALVYFSHDLPDIAQLLQVTRRPGITLLARDGSLIATYGDLYGDFVDVKDLPPHVYRAIIATEDRRFFEHFGIDPIGIVRAFYRNYKAGSVVQGGSTLTQQLGKNFLFSEGKYAHSDRSLRRKVQEVILALWLESKFSKNQILSVYLNRVYLGAGVYGLEAAAQKYFGKHARDLSLYESAIIAGLLKAPSKYSPTNNPKLADERARVVLNSMVEAGFVTTEEVQQALLHPSVASESRSKNSIGRYFSDWIFESLDEFIGRPNQDIVVKTTLDLRLQKMAEEKAHEMIQTEGKNFNVSETALVAMTPDGGVRALVGGYSYAHSQYNRATQARRQTGSTFKFFTYLSAVERGYTPETMVSDELIAIGKWRPSNYKWKARGQITLRDAFAFSVNATAVRLAHEVGMKTLARTARRLGLTSRMPDNLTLALGSGEATLLEFTSAFATVANHGFGVFPYGILEITDREGNILYRRQSQGTGRVVAPQHVAHMLTLMQAATDYGTAKRAKLDRPTAGKSGTSQNYRDAWFIGFTADLVAGVWMGNDDGAYMQSITGGKLPAQLWHNFMEAAHEGLPIRSFPVLD
ncbi:MAG: transglycosylase domain-containing protein [Holosporales bacterium]